MRINGSYRSNLRVATLANTRNRLRVHATQEWHDLYQESTNAELQAFLDRYTKGFKNNWEQTPKVRVSILRYNQVRIPNRYKQTWKRDN
jgi:predicted acyl esterase